LHLRPGAGFATRPHGLARHPDRPHPVLRFPAHRPGADLRVFDPVPAVHRAGPGVLQRDPPAGAAGSGWRRVRGRQPGAPARREPREPAEPAEQSAGHGVDIRTIPLVLQYNKQDLPRELILSPADLDDALNFRGVPSFSADALHGTGVFETLKGISELVLKKLAAGTAA